MLIKFGIFFIIVMFGHIINVHLIKNLESLYILYYGEKITTHFLLCMFLGYAVPFLSLFFIMIIKHNYNKYKKKEHWRH